jgi:outer membrane protein OmpA-like peptidoglycan-associated protein
VSGTAGPQGARGATGVQGPMAENGSWSVYRNYTFDRDSDRILQADSGKAREVAEYANHNPSYRVAIDGPNAQHVSTVRDALIDAGVPKSRISTGSFGDPQLRRDREVAVLLAN